MELMNCSGGTQETKPRGLHEMLLNQFLLPSKLMSAKLE